MSEAELRALRRAAFEAQTGDMSDWAKPMAAALRRAHVKLEALLAPPVPTSRTEERQQAVDAAFDAVHEWRENPPVKGFE